MKLLILFSVFFSSAVALASPATFRPTDSHQVLPHLNTGWGNISFSQLQASLDPKRNYITWLIHSPDWVMDLSDPELFRQSLVADKAYKSDGISHMMVAWQCQSGGRTIRGATGLTGLTQNQTQDMIKNGWGQTALFALTLDGELNTAFEVDGLLDHYAKKGGDVSHLTFEVEAADCQRMLAYLKKFIDHPNQPGVRFGLNVDPLKFEGGGCGSFVSAMLTHAGILKGVQSRLWRTLKGSLSLMGGGLAVPANTELRLPPELHNHRNHVFFGDLELTHWGAGDGPAIKLVDPELGLLAMRTIAHDYLRDNGLAADALESTSFRQRVIKYRRLYVDRWGVTRQGIFQKAFTAEHDTQARSVAQQAHSGWHSLKKRGLRATPVYLNAFWGLILSK